MADCITNKAKKDEDMAAIGDWALVEDAGTDISQVTFDSRSCMKLSTGTTAGNDCRATEDVGSFSVGGADTVALTVYFDSLNTGTANGTFRLTVESGDNSIILCWSADGLYAYFGAQGYQLICSVTVQVWTLWTIQLNWHDGDHATIDVWKDSVRVADNQPCQYVSGGETNGECQFRMWSDGTDRIAYVDSFQSGNALDGDCPALTDCFPDEDFGINDMGDKSDWTLTEDAGCSVDDVIEDNRFCQKHSSGTTQWNNTIARYDFGSFVRYISFSIRAKFMSLKTGTADGTFRITIEIPPIALNLWFSASGVYVRDDSAGYTKVGDIVMDEWATWMFQSDMGHATPFCHVWKDNVRAGVSIPCEFTYAGQNGRVDMRVYSDGTDRIIYIDHIKVGDGVTGVCAEMVTGNPGQNVIVVQ